MLQGISSYIHLCLHWNYQCNEFLNVGFLDQIIYARMSLIDIGKNTLYRGYLFTCLPVIWVSVSIHLDVIRTFVFVSFANIITLKKKGNFCGCHFHPSYTAVLEWTPPSLLVPTYSGLHLFPPYQACLGRCRHLLTSHRFPVVLFYHRSPFIDRLSR